MMTSGILLLDKSIHMSSNAALQKAKRLFGIKKAGHTGSLDPLATGMLPLCFGEATKFSQYLLEADKYYCVTMQLGVTTTTGDAEGEIVLTRPVKEVTETQIKKILTLFRGEIQQIPPMYSAIKQNGKPLYELARKGITVERKPRTVHIYNLKFIQLTNDCLTLEVHCSKGTYIRTLVEDIGEQLDCGAYVIELRRLAVAPYEQQKMYSLDQLSEMIGRDGMTGLNSFLLPIETALQKLPAIRLTMEMSYYFRLGQSIRVPISYSCGLIRIFSEDEKFLGLGEMLDDGRIAPKRLISSLLSCK